MKKLEVLFALVLIIAFAVPVFAADMAAEIPKDSWEYEAFAKLADKGIITTQPTTRGEATSVLLNILMPGDILKKVNNEEAEMLEKLVAEFKEEFDACSVVVNALDDIIIIQP